MTTIIKFNPYAIEDVYMTNSDAINYIHRTTGNLQKISTMCQIPPGFLSNNEVRKIHFGFSAGKLENQSESANLSNDISTLSVNYEGVIL